MPPYHTLHRPTPPTTTYHPSTHPTLTMKNPACQPSLGTDPGPSLLSMRSLTLTYIQANPSSKILLRLA